MKCAVIGLGRYGKSLATQLHEARVEVVAIDVSGEPVDEIRGSVAVAIRLDATIEEEMRAQGLGAVDVAVVAIGTNFEGAALTTALLKKLGVKRVIARATSPLRGRILRLIGADDIVSPEEEAARETTRRIVRPALADYLKLTSARSVVEVIAPKSFQGRTLKDLDLRRRFKVSVLGIKRDVPVGDPADEKVQETLIDTSDAQQTLQVGDRLIAVGDDTDLARFVKEMERE